VQISGELPRNVSRFAIGILIIQQMAEPSMLNYIYLCKFALGIKMNIQGIEINPKSATEAKVVFMNFCFVEVWLSQQALDFRLCQAGTRYVGFDVVGHAASVAGNIIKRSFQGLPLSFIEAGSSKNTAFVKPILPTNERDRDNCCNDDQSTKNIPKRQEVAGETAHFARCLMKEKSPFDANRASKKLRHTA
jgi:hypothetical protein